MDLAMFPFSLAAVDIDDTLVGPDKRISVENREALASLQSLGVRVVLASGRAHREMAESRHALGLRDFMVSSQGALVRHLDSDLVLYECPLRMDVARRVIDRAIAQQLTLFSFGREMIYARPGSYWPQSFDGAVQRGSVVIDERLAETVEPPLKLIWAVEPDTLDGMVVAATREFAAEAVGLCVTNRYSLEFSDPAATKAVGVRAVAEHNGIPAERVLAFGDGNNDVPLLEWAGLGVAMDQGTAAALAVAKRVSPPGNPETSLARAIRQLIAEH